MSCIRKKENSCMYVCLYAVGVGDIVLLSFVENLNIHISALQLPLFNPWNEPILVFPFFVVQFALMFSNPINNRIDPLEIFQFYSEFRYWIDKFDACLICAKSSKRRRKNKYNQTYVKMCVRGMLVQRVSVLFISLQKSTHQQ